MVMPATPTPHFIMPQAEVLFAFLKAGLNRPAHATQACQGLQGGGRGRVAHIGLQFPASRLRLSTSQTSGPGKPSRTATTRDTAKSATRGPLLPSLISWRDHCALGRLAATALTSSASAWLTDALGWACDPNPTTEGRPSQALPPHPRVMRHFGKVPQTAAGHLVEQCRVTSKGFVTRHPATPQHLVVHHRANHVPAQFGLGLEGNIGNTTCASAVCVAIVFNPFLRQIQAAIQQGVACVAGIAQKDACLTVGAFADFPTVLTLDADRLATLLQKVTPVQGQHSVFVPQCLIHCAPVALKNGLIAPRPGTDKLLHAAYGVGIVTSHGQHHGLDRFARDVQQQAMEIVGRPLPLFATLEQAKRVVGPQFVDQVVNVVVSAPSLETSQSGRHTALLYEIGQYDMILKSRCSTRD